MTDAAELLTRGAIIGMGGAAFMDGWALFSRRVLHIQGLDYALLGRWIGHMRRGRFFHERIALADPVRDERLLGWVAHYSIGMAFSLMLLALCGLDWAHSPTLLPPLTMGLCTIVAPWFVMHPAMGAGIAASATPNPRAARLRNLATHAAYGVGLYASALVLSIVWT